MKDSFIFYRSFYESAKELNQKDRLKFYDAVIEFALNQNETELKGASKAVFIAIKPQIIANNKRYENGTKGGRKKGNQTKTKTEPNENQDDTKTIPNENDNVNENENVNENDNVNDNVFGSFETELNRTLSQEEKEKIISWLKQYGEEDTLFALRNAIVAGVTDFNYINRILEIQHKVDDAEDEGY